MHLAAAAAAAQLSLSTMRYLSSITRHCKRAREVQQALDSEQQRLLVTSCLTAVSFTHRLVSCARDVGPEAPQPPPPHNQQQQQGQQGPPEGAAH
jgi:hypothetical protein